eukprot:SM000024S07731  [mRNA]  locus=s24:609:1219:- [translate_table: standard]
MSGHVKVARCFYIDNDSAAREAAKHHSDTLKNQYPLLITDSKFLEWHSFFLRDIREAAVSPVLNRLPPVDLIIAGFPYQGFSPIGVGRGFTHPETALFKPFMKFLHAVQARQTKNLGYIVESVEPRENYSKARFDFNTVYRRRAHWTNLAPAKMLQACINRLVLSVAGARLSNGYGVDLPNEAG